MSRASRAPGAASPREPLPIDALLPELVAALRREGNAVLRAETGAGKTTRVPPALLGSGLVGEGRVLLVEPRRIAARSAARRMAAEWGADLGREIGYQVRFEKRWGEATRILAVTDGVLLRQLQADPFLEGVAAVVFDEFHERRLDSDLALAMVRRVQREVRSDLHVVVMSATLESEPVALFLGGCPVLESEGRRFPVEISYLGDDAPLRAPPPATPFEMVREVARAVPRCFDRARGDLLVFLPGVGEIRRVEELLRSWAGTTGVLLMPLYGDLAAERQDAALRPQARPRVVLATNVAESSVTVDGVVGVIDTGWARVLRYDPGRGLDRLELARISQASADQRAGRAGRQGPGSCLRLWSQGDQRVAWDAPEVRRVDPAGAVLQLAAWGETDPAAFPWFEPPEPAALEAASRLLRRIDALDHAGAVTTVGRAMVSIPAQPRAARLVVESHRRGCSARGALAAALLTERWPFERDPPHRRTVGSEPATSQSDMLDAVEALEAFERGRGAGPDGPDLRIDAARAVLRAAHQLASAADRALGPAPAHDDSFEAFSRSLLAAFPDRLARRRSPGEARAVMLGGRGVVLAAESAVRAAELFLCLEVDGGRRAETSDALVRRASAVVPEWLPQDRLSVAVEVELDPRRGRVVAWRRRRFEDLVLEEVECPVPEEDAARVLAAAASEIPEQVLPLDDPEVAGFLARVRSLAHWRPDLDLPDFDAELWCQLLPTLCAGKRSFDELRRVPLLDFLQGSLSHHQRTVLEREAPERIEVPSGSRLRLVYEPGQAPVLAARIQELFGLEETPAVAGGRVPVLLHLLAPNHRPQQVTQDLASFWRNTYPQVRKELQGRYPKHSWPADPLNAPAEKRPRRRS